MRADGGDGPTAEGRAGVGPLLRVWRERALLTQEQLAERAGMSARTVRRLESDEVVRPQSATLRLLAAALNLSSAEQQVLVLAARAAPANAHGSSGLDAAVANDVGGGDQCRPGPSPPVAGHVEQLSPVVPRQLPAPPQAFMGRALELTRLDRDRDLSSVVITAIDGMAGVGKTALAVQAAHQLSGHYPDGQLFIDLHGYTEGVPPVPPAEALDRLLRALGVVGPQIPEHADDRAALYRSLLADRKILVVLDNAATTDQVQPLLPGSPGCLVLITSRRRLAGFDHTHTLSLDVLPSSAAIALFASTANLALGAEDAAAVSEVVELCGRLPLAIRIAAARLRSRPSWTTGHLVERLHDRRDRLGELEAGSRSVTAALDVSYLQLAPEARRAYRLASLHPGTDLDSYAVAALAHTTIDMAEHVITELLESHLIQEPSPGRYRFHDLVRAHAAIAASRDETESDRQAAFGRLLGYYAHTTSDVVDLAHPFDAAYPWETDRRPGTPPSESPTPPLADDTQALSWVDAELDNLLAVAQVAPRFGRADHTGRQATMLHRHLRIRGRYDDALALFTIALEHARAAGDRVCVHHALLGLGCVHLWQGRYPEAADCVRQTLSIARDTGNRTGELFSLHCLGDVARMQNRFDVGADYLERALAIALEIGNRIAEQDALNCLGQLYQATARDSQAMACYQRAMTICEEIRHQSGQLHALRGMGDVYWRQGHHPAAVGTYRQVVALGRATGNPVSEQYGLFGLGNAHRHFGEYEQAFAEYQQVLAIARRIGDRDYQLRAHQGLGRVSHETGHHHDALDHHTIALEIACLLGQPGDQASAHDGVAHALEALGDSSASHRHWCAALDILVAHDLDHTNEPDVTAAAIQTHLEGLGD